MNEATGTASAALKGNLMAGKRGLVMGVANNRSIAWGIAKACADLGAELAFTYQGEALQKRVLPLAESVGSNLVMPCDVTDAASMDAVFERLSKEWGKLDFLVHAIAYAKKDALDGRYVDTSLENFTASLAISCYSFTALCHRAEPLMTDGGSLVTLTYYGSEKVIPHYNVMGVAKAALEASVRYLAVDLGRNNIRVNAICPGMFDTNLFESSVPKEEWEPLISMVPMKRFGKPHEIAYGTIFLASDESSFMTGTDLVIDGGYTCP